MKIEPISIEEIFVMLGKQRSDSVIQSMISKYKEFSEIDVEEIQGVKYEYVEFKLLGLCLYFEEEELTSIFMRSEDAGEGYSNYSWELPLGARFGATKSWIESRIGNPDESGGGYNGQFGPIPVWIKYNKKTYSVHYQFNAKDALEMVTVE